MSFNGLVEDCHALDRAYTALADPTRRALLVALRAGEARITDLAAPLPMSLAAVSRHVGVLEEAGLISRRVRGREHWLSVDSDGLRTADALKNLSAMVLLSAITHLGHLRKGGLCS